MSLARSFWRARNSPAIRWRCCAFSTAGTQRHSLKASRAARTARSASAARPRGTWSITSSVAGLTTAIESAGGFCFFRKFFLRLAILFLDLFVDLLERIRKFVDHLVEQFVADIQRRLDADGACAEQRASHEHAALEQRSGDPVTDEAVRELQADEQSFAAHFLQNFRIQRVQGTQALHEVCALLG